MSNLTAAQQRFLDNAVFIAASRLIFAKLEETGMPVYLLGDIAKTTSGGTPKRSVTEYYDGDIPWIKSGELNDGLIEQVEEYITAEALKNSSAKVYPAGTLVIALYGATVGKTGILAFNAASNQAVCAVFPKKQNISRDYLYWFLRHKRADFLEISFGGAQPNISQRILRETPLPVPHLELQQIICDFLGAIDQRQSGAKVAIPQLPDILSDIPHTIARIEELAARIEEARGLRQRTVEEAEAFLPSVVDAVLSGTNAELVTVESIAHSVTDGDHQAPPKVESGIPFIFISNVVNGAINFDNCRYVTQEYFKSLSPMRIPRPGDVLYTAVGSYGIPCLVEIDTPFCFQRHIAIIKPNNEHIMPEYLTWALSSSDTFQQATEYATGSAQLTVPLRGIRKLEFPLPSLNEQEEIVAYLDSLQSHIYELKRLQAETAAELDALLPSILDKAFKGEL